MGLLDSLFGGSKSSSTQRQESNAFGYSANSAGSSSISGASSSGRSGGVSGSSGASRSGSSVFSSDILRQLYSSALGAADSINPGLATERVNQLFTGGTSILDNLSSGGAGVDYLERRLTGDNNEVLNAQIGAIGEDLGSFFRDEINPTITGNAVAAGALGGGRQGVAQGSAVSDILKEFSTQAANLRAQDITNRDAAALGLLGAQNANAQTGVSAIGQLSGLTSDTAALDPYSQLAQILGAPTVLTESESAESSFGQEFSEQQANEFAQSIAEELGISYDEARSLMTGTSKSKSSGGIFSAISLPFGGKG